MGDEEATDGDDDNDHDESLLVDPYHGNTDHEFIPDPPEISVDNSMLQFHPKVK